MNYKVFYVPLTNVCTHVGCTELPEPCPVSELPNAYGNGFYNGETDPLNPPTETWPCVSGQGVLPISITTIEDGEVEGEEIVGPVPPLKPTKKGEHEELDQE